jgi:hypothetical protein
MENADCSMGRDGAIGTMWHGRTDHAERVKLSLGRAMIFYRLGRVEPTSVRTES